MDCLACFHESSVTDLNSIHPLQLEWSYSPSPAFDVTIFLQSDWRTDSVISNSEKLGFHHQYIYSSGQSYSSQKIISEWLINTTSKNIIRTQYLHKEHFKFSFWVYSQQLCSQVTWVSPLQSSTLVRVCYSSEMGSFSNYIPLWIPPPLFLFYFEYVKH